MAAPNAQVIRDGHQVTVPGRELVPGDLVLLEAGNYVPADMRLVSSVNLKVEEASLTGESVPVEKNAAVMLDKEIPLGDRKNSAFMSTMVTYGRGKGLVTGTGMNTQIGMIAEMIQSYEDEDTPLQQKLQQLGKVLGTACLAICGIVLIYGLFRDARLTDVFEIGFWNWLQAEQKDIINLFMTAVQPRHRGGARGPAGDRDDLPRARHAADDQAPCADPQAARGRDARLRDGDLLRQDRHAHPERDDRGPGMDRGKRFKVTGEGYNPTGKFLLDDKAFDPGADADGALLLQGALLCNDAQARPGPHHRRSHRGRHGRRGDEGGPTREQKTMPRVQEIPFDSDRKRMTTIHRADTGVLRSSRARRCRPRSLHPYTGRRQGGPARSREAP